MSFVLPVLFLVCLPLSWLMYGMQMKMHGPATDPSAENYGVHATL